MQEHHESTGSPSASNPAPAAALPGPDDLDEIHARGLAELERQEREARRQQRRTEKGGRR